MTKINLCYDGGRLILSRFLIIAFTKNPPLDHTLRHPCKFLILAIFYHAKKKSQKFTSLVLMIGTAWSKLLKLPLHWNPNLLYKKFYYVNKIKLALFTRDHFKT